jgi:hypothetical protein
MDGWVEPHVSARHHHAWVLHGHHVTMACQVLWACTLDLDTEEDFNRLFNCGLMGVLHGLCGIMDIARGAKWLTTRYGDVTARPLMLPSVPFPTFGVRGAVATCSPGVLPTLYVLLRAHMVCHEQRS